MDGLLQHHDDLIALAEKQEGGWFDGVLEDMLGIFPRSITRVRATCPARILIDLTKY